MDVSILAGRDRALLGRTPWSRGVSQKGGMCRGCCIVFSARLSVCLYCCLRCAESVRDVVPRFDVCLARHTYVLLTPYPCIFRTECCGRRQTSAMSWRATCTPCATSWWELSGRTWRGKRPTTSGRSSRPQKTGELSCLAVLRAGASVGRVYHSFLLFGIH